MTKLCLATRYFYMDKREGTGIGRISYELLKGLGQYPEFSIVPIQTKRSGLVNYFKYSMFELPKRLPKDIDIYHALTPIEGMFMPKDRTVVTYHDLFQITNPNLIGGGMGYSYWKHLVGTKYFEMACRISSKAKRIICVSEKTKEEVIQHLKVPEEKVRIITWGIPNDLEPRNTKHEELTIGYLGMLDKRKRVDLLIKDFHKSKIKAKLLIGGRGLDEALLWDLAEKDRRIIFLGFVPEGKLCEFYNLLDIFIFPTAVEGYGLPIVEALACGVPVVVLSDSLIPEEVKKYCGVTESVATLLSNLNRYNISTGPNPIVGSLKFAQSHKWSRTVEKYIEVYKEILNE